MGKIIKFDTGKQNRKKTAKDSYSITNTEFTEAARKFEKSADSEGLNVLIYEGEHLFDLYRQMIYHPLK